MEGSEDTIVLNHGEELHSAGRQSASQATRLDAVTAGPPRPRRRPSLKLKLIVAAGTFAVGLAFCEVGLRLFGRVTDVPFMFWDPLIGPRREPNQAGTYYTGLEIVGRYRFNQQGWNNIHDSYQTIKPPGTVRVCLVGDSMVEALNVNVEDSMASVAERTMSRPGRPAQWYTFANSGYGTTHEYLLIRHYALEYRPDVVVMLFIANDPVDSSVYMAPQESWMAKLLLAEDGELVYVPPTQYVPSLLKRIGARSAMVRYLLIQKRLFDRGVPPLPKGAMPIREGIAAGLSDSPSTADSMEDRVQRTWELLEATLKRTREECEDRGAKFLLVYQGDRWPIEAAAEKRNYTPPPRDVDPLCTGERSYAMGRQYLEPIASRLGIAYLDLTDALIAACRATGRRYNYIDDGHFSPFGHQIAGETMAAAVEQLLNQPGRPPAPREP